MFYVHGDLEYVKAKDTPTLQFKVLKRAYQLTEWLHNIFMVLSLKKLLVMANIDIEATENVG